MKHFELEKLLQFGRSLLHILDVGYQSKLHLTFCCLKGISSQWLYLVAPYWKNDTIKFEKTLKVSVLTYDFRLTAAILNPSFFGSGIVLEL
jgi:hypothetical protein